MASPMPNTISRTRKRRCSSSGLTYSAEPNRHQYLVAIEGRIAVNGSPANPRDCVAITGERAIVAEALDDAELVLVDSR